MYDISLGMIQRDRNAHDVVTVELAVAIDVDDHTSTGAEPFGVCGEGRGAVSAIGRRSDDLGERVTRLRGSVGRGVVENDERRGTPDGCERGLDLREKSRQPLGFVERRYHNRDVVLRLHLGIPASLRTQFTRHLPRTCSV
nr:hypothetical protein [Microbacterium testaceum]